MASINIVGDYKKSGLTQKQLEETIEAVFFEVKSKPSYAQELRAGKKLKVKSCYKTINIAFIESDKIREFNKQYRKIDKPTDVLSFDYEDEGDILLCIDIIDEYKDDDNLRDSVTKTLIHGALHLFGYDHENDKDHAIMDEISNKVFRTTHYKP